MYRRAQVCCLHRAWQIAPCLPRLALILQCSEDIIASEEVGKFVRSKIAGSQIVFWLPSGPYVNGPTLLGRSWGPQHPMMVDDEKRLDLAN
jgi:hypothetical protein